MDLSQGLWIAMWFLVTGAFVAAGYRRVGPAERLVIWRLGRLHRVAPPGGVVVWPFLDRGVAIDMRPQTVTLELPVLTSQEGTWHAATATVSFAVLQPERVAAQGGVPAIATRDLVEKLLREAAAALTADELRTETPHLGRAVKKAANEVALAAGVDLTQVEIVRLEPIPTPLPA